MEIISYIGVGNIYFGMSINEVRNVVGGEAIPFLKSSQSSIPTDSFHEDSIHIFYKESGVCEAIEFYKPANPILKGRSFIGRPLSEIRGWLEEQDSKMEIDNGSLISFKLGIGLYIPNIKESNAVIESLIAFESGYYDI